MTKRSRTTDPSHKKDRKTKLSLSAAMRELGRIRGGLAEIAMFTKPSTVKSVQALTGKSETFVVETCRHEELGDYIFVEMLDENGVVRIALPLKVANLIASQHDAPTARRRSAVGGAAALPMPFNTAFLGEGVKLVDGDAHLDGLGHAELGGIGAEVGVEEITKQVRLGHTYFFGKGKLVAFRCSIWA
jgi:hypothetical protein